MDVLLVGGASDPLVDIQNALSTKGKSARIATTLGEARSALSDEGTPHAVLLAPGLAPPDAVLLASSLRVRHRQCRVIAMLSAAESSRAGELERVGVKEVMAAGTPAVSVADALARPITATPQLTNFGEVPSEEIHSLETLYSREPDSTDVQWLLGFAYYRAGRAAEAVPLFQGLARDEERGAQAMYYLGAAFYQLDRNLEAIATWDQVCRIYKGSLFASKAAEHAARARTKSAT